MKRFGFSLGTTITALRDLAAGKTVDDYDLPPWLKEKIKGRCPFTEQEINAAWAKVIDKARSEGRWPPRFDDWPTWSERHGYVHAGYVNGKPHLVKAQVRR